MKNNKKPSEDSIAMDVIKVVGGKTIKNIPVQSRGAANRGNCQGRKHQRGIFTNIQLIIILSYLVMRGEGGAKFQTYPWRS